MIDDKYLKKEEKAIFLPMCRRLISLINEVLLPNDFSLVRKIIKKAITEEDFNELVTSFFLEGEGKLMFIF